jgi:hypothetical protein
MHARKDPLANNSFGFTLGGPSKPKVCNGHNKTFFSPTLTGRDPLECFRASATLIRRTHSRGISARCSDTGTVGQRCLGDHLQGSFDPSTTLVAFRCERNGFSPTTGLPSPGRRTYSPINRIQYGASNFSPDGSSPSCGIYQQRSRQPRGRDRYATIEFARITHPNPG